MVSRSALFWCVGDLRGLWRRNKLFWKSCCCKSGVREICDGGINFFRNLVAASKSCESFPVGYCKNENSNSEKRGVCLLVILKLLAKINVSILK